MSCFGVRIHRRAARPLAAENAAKPEGAAAWGQAALRHDGMDTARNEAALFFFNQPSQREVYMVPVTILLDDATAEFYAKVADAADRPVETVLANALFKLAGELSLNALARTAPKEE